MESLYGQMEQEMLIKKTEIMSLKTLMNNLSGTEIELQQVKREKESLKRRFEDQERVILEMKSKQAVVE